MNATGIRPVCQPTPSDLAAFGLSLIPIQRGTKIPPTGLRWSEYRDAGTTREQVAAWSAEYPKSNWGLILGRASGGVIAVDVDSIEAFRWCELRQGGFNQEPPVWFETGRGWQWLFRLPSDLLDVRGVNPHAGVEIRCDRQYSVLPPSRHPSGKPYVWRRPPTSLESIPPAPAWVLGCLTADRRPTRAHGETTKPGTGSRGVNPGLLRSSVYVWLRRSRFLKGSRQAAFYCLALIQKGAGFSRAESWRDLTDWRERRCVPAYGGPGDDDPDGPARVFAAVWSHGYRPTVRHLRAVSNSEGRRITAASALALCRIYPDTRPRSRWEHEPAVVGAFRILEALARKRVGVRRPEPLSHAQLAELAGISEARVMHAAPFLSALGVRSVQRRGRSAVSHYSLTALNKATPHTVCSTFVRSTAWRGRFLVLWRRVLRCFGAIVRKLRDALNAVQVYISATSLGETRSGGPPECEKARPRGPPIDPGRLALVAGAPAGGLTP